MVGRKVFEKIVMTLSAKEVQQAVADYLQERVGGNFQPRNVKFLADNSVEVVAFETELPQDGK